MENKYDMLHLIFPLDNHLAIALKVIFPRVKKYIFYEIFNGYFIIDLYLLTLL